MGEVSAKESDCCAPDLAAGEVVEDVVVAVVATKEAT